MGNSHPSDFSIWMRGDLKSSWEGLIAQDIDLVVFNEDKFCIIEEKHERYARVGAAQAVVFKMLYEFLNLQSKFKLTGIFLVHYLSDSEIYINKRSRIPKEELTELFRTQDSDKLSQYHEEWWDEIVNYYLKNFWDCTGKPPERGTRKERSFYRETKLSYIPNSKTIHWIFINYCTGYFVILEVQENGKGNFKPNENEKNLVSYLHNAFQEAQEVNSRNKKVRNPASQKPYEYLGYYL